MRVLDLRGQTLSNELVNAEVPRAPLDISGAIQEITPLLADVKANGEQALLNVAARFGNSDPKPFRVSAHELAQALDALKPSLREAIQESINRVRKVCQAVMPTETTVELAPGATVRQRWQPVDSVGLYVPGGKAVYPSSVVMNVVPAQVAGVPRLAIATPAQAEFGNRPHPVVLATAAMLGVTEVYNIGGPAAVAAFAYGVPEIPLERVAMVTGPGNIYVAAAKRALRGVIGIDSEAGTTEILIVADESADGRLIAFDLVSQAEHDEAAACVLVTASERLIESVLAQIDAVAAETENSARVIAALRGIQSALVLVDSTDAALEFADCYATEHLELHTVDPIRDAARVSNAGALFLGKYSPVSLGDYLAGSNHVLPTGEQAKFGSGLGVHTFLRAQQLIEYDAEALETVAEAAREFSNSERLPAHGEAIAARFKDK
jgi:histidinol dehydrogenase